MVKKTYKEKLLDPRWQKKRLEILQRDNFTCVYCDDKETTLHIHHLRYRKGAEPWDYLSDELETVCSDCHELIHIGLTELEWFLVQCVLNRDYDKPVDHKKKFIQIVKTFK